MRYVLLVILTMTLATGCATVDDDKPGTRAGWSMDGKPMPACSPATDTLALLVSGKAPVYPVKRLMLKEDGYAELAFDITPEGRAARFESISHSHPSFYAHAKAAIAEWKFKAATDDQVPVTVRCLYRQNFRVSGDRRRAP